MHDMLTVLIWQNYYDYCYSTLHKTYIKSSESSQRTFKEKQIATIDICLSDV